MAPIEGFDMAEWERQRKADIITRHNKFRGLKKSAIDQWLYECADHLKVGLWDTIGRHPRLISPESCAEEIEDLLRLMRQREGASGYIGPGTGPYGAMNAHKGRVIRAYIEFLNSNTEEDVCIAAADTRDWILHFAEALYRYRRNDTRRNAPLEQEETWQETSLSELIKLPCRQAQHIYTRREEP